MEDSEIVDLYLRRDEEALRQTAEKYGGRLHALANSILDDRGAAEECENDAYLEAWSSIPPHEPRTYLFIFLARIIRHLAIDCCRKRSSLKRSASIVELTEEIERCVPSQDCLENHADGPALGSSISAWLRQLPEERRNIFIRRYWYLDPIAAISRRFSISESKVKTSLFRSRNALREYLKKEGYAL